MTAPFQPTPEQRTLVGIMAACGFPQAQIAERVGCDAKTLRKAFRKELTDGKTAANAIVAQSLFKKATGSGQGAVTAAIFWMKCQAGWKETQAVELTGKDGGPLKTQGVPHDLSALTDAELETLAALGEKLSGGGAGGD